MQTERFRKILEVTLVILFFSAFTLSLLKPITDPDVFWHLKTGEWIWHNKTLPDKDPFSSTFTLEPSQYETAIITTFTLKQYWLAQLIMYGFYKLLNWYGIIVFRCLVYLGIGLILYRWMGKKGIGRMDRLIFLLPAVLFSVWWLGERPNNISFLFTIAVIYLLEDLSSNSSSSKSLYRSKLIMLPLIMFLWANMHPGFILGDAIIVIYIFSEIFGSFYSKSRHKTSLPSVFSLKHFFIISFISILSSFANPSTYKIVPVVFEPNETFSFVFPMEMKSPFEYAEWGNYTYLMIIGAVFLIFLLSIKRLSLNAILLLSFFTILSLIRIRFISFLIFTAIPFIAHGNFLTETATKTKSFFTLHVIRCYISAVIVSIFVTIFISKDIDLSIFKLPPVHYRYPETIVKFIKKERPEGRLFNYYDYGGYLIWHLYPDYEVFIDGRGRPGHVFVQYLKTLFGSTDDSNGIPEWKTIFYAYRVNAVIVPASDSMVVGFIRLVRRLVEDKDWNLVCKDKEALLFIRNTERNSEITKKYAIPKESAYEVALERAEVYRKKHPKDWRAYITLGEINLYLERPQAAILYFESAQKFIPSSKMMYLTKLIANLKADIDHRELLDEIYK